MLWIGVAIQAASAILQGVQANKNGQNARAASDAAAAYANELKAYSEANPYAAVQATDISTMTQDRNAQAQAQGVDALQGQGAEGAGQITALTNAVDESNLAAAEAQAKLNYNRDAAQADAQGEINRRKEERDTGLISDRITGAQQAAADAESQKNENLNGIVSSVASGIGELGGEIDYLRGNKGKAGVSKPDGGGNTEIGGMQYRGEDVYRMTEKLKTK